MAFSVESLSVSRAGLVPMLGGQSTRATPNHLQMTDGCVFTSERAGRVKRSVFNIMDKYQNERLVPARPGPIALLRVFHLILTTVPIALLFFWVASSLLPNIGLFSIDVGDH